MRDLQINDKYYHIAEKWNELSATQLIGIMDVFYNDVEPDEADLILLKILTKQSWLRLWLVGGDAIQDACHVLDFLKQSNELSVNLLPRYKHRYGASDNFNNLLVSEFVFTEMYFIAYRNDDLPGIERNKNLNRLVAVLYRAPKENYDFKKNPDGDTRKAFNENLIEQDEKIIERWPINVKRAIAHWYDGCRNNLVKDFSEVFSTSGGDVNSAKYGLWDLIYNIAEKQLFGDFSKVEQQYLKTILMAVTKMIIEADRLEQKMKAS